MKSTKLTFGEIALGVVAVVLTFRGLPAQMPDRALAYAMMPFMFFSGVGMHNIIARLVIRSYGGSASLFSTSSERSFAVAGAIIGAAAGTALAISLLLESRSLPAFVLSICALLVMASVFSLVALGIARFREAFGLTGLRG